MKKPNITPGPWASNADTVWLNRAFQAVCSPYHHPQSVANARAIAAVPDLLAALERVLSRAPHIDQSATHEGLENCSMLAACRGALLKSGYTF